MNFSLGTFIACLNSGIIYNDFPSSCVSRATPLEGFSFPAMTMHCPLGDDGAVLITVSSTLKNISTTLLFKPSYQAGA